MRCIGAPKNGLDQGRPVNRDDKLTFGISKDVHRGVEIGALNNPIISPASGRCEYVDYTDTAGLKEQHKGLPDRAAGIVDVNHIWRGSGSLADVVGGVERYDYAIASHVIEHVPNTLGWFRGILDTLKPGGIFNLAIPDKRYTFDVNCPVSTIGQVIEADLLNLSTPSVRQMFDHCVHIAKIEPGDIWKAPLDPGALPPFNGEYALWLAETQAKQIVEHGAYFDSHCWIYTPDSFLRILRQAALLNRFSFEIVQFFNTEPDQFEFFVSLRRPDHGASAEDLKMRQISAIDQYLSSLNTARWRAALAAE